VAEAEGVVVAEEEAAAVDWRVAAEAGADSPAEEQREERAEQSGVAEVSGS
jgi:hypothetical protein